SVFEAGDCIRGKLVTGVQTCALPIFLGNYTYSKGFDTSTDFNSDYGPQDPTNLGLDRGLSAFDERHKVVIAGVFDSPWKSPVIRSEERRVGKECRERRSMECTK